MVQPTPKRNLPTAQPVWMEGLPAPTGFPPLERAAEVDDAVIGCGAPAADAARQAGKGNMAVPAWTCATGPQPDRLRPSRCLIWQPADPFLTDGRVGVGGEDAKFSDDRGQKLGALPELALAGCFGKSPHGLPAMGPVTGAERCVAVFGFGGKGITFSATAARLLQRMLPGAPDPGAALFGFRS